MLSFGEKEEARLVWIPVSRIAKAKIVGNTIDSHKKQKKNVPMADVL